ncbi:MAG: hypothetical protein LBM93_03735 [Oscillospiraceae bacterium]|jgi:hypothetical protein|nr:hypothetical protein [Oscillospiraceae bacterium]
MFKRIFILTIVIFSIFLFGCQSKKQTPTTPAVTIEHIKGTFDFDTVLANTTINNRQISSNSKFKDLGNGFTLGDCFLDLGEFPEYDRDTKFYNLLYSKEKVGSIEIDLNEKIFELRLEDNISYIYDMNFNLCSINFDSDLQDIIDVFGVSDYNDGNDFLRYGKKESSNIAFRFMNYELYAIEINIVGDITNE